MSIRVDLAPKLGGLVKRLAREPVDSVVNLPVDKNWSAAAWRERAWIKGFTVMVMSRRYKSGS